MDDRELLRRYTMGEAGAFVELVRRHRDWVYSVCLRRLGDEGLAEDATQVVFLALAREAGKVAGHPRVLGWLHRVSRYTAMKVRREEVRRERRERKAGAMSANQEGREEWEALRGVIEEAIDRLNAREKEAVLLRFYRQLSHAEVGKEMGVSEEAAKKRVNRALERLRGIVKGRGVEVTGAGIGAALVGHAVVRAPAALGAALEVAPAGNGSSLVSSLTKEVQQMMTRMKLATMALWAGVAVVTVSAVTMMVLPAGSRGAARGAEALPRLQAAWHYKAEDLPGAESPGEQVDLSNPMVENGVVYFGDFMGAVRAVDMAKDQKVWTANVPGRLSSVMVDDKHVYVGGEKGLVALAKGTGEVAWRLDAAGRTGECVSDAESDMLFVGGFDGVLYGLDRNSGEKKWTHSFLEEGVKSNGNGLGRGEVVQPEGISTDGKMVFLSVFDQSRVIACDAATGERKWAFTAKDSLGDRATFDDRRVFVGAMDDYLYCLEKISGQVEWKFKTNGWIISSPLVMGDLVIVPSGDGFLYAVKKGTGELAWKFETDVDEKGKPGGICSELVLRRGLVWFATVEGHVYGLDAAKGTAVVKFVPSEGSEVVGGPSVDEKYLCVTTRRKNEHSTVGPPTGEGGVFGFGLEARK